MVRSVTVLLPWGTDEGHGPSYVGHFPDDLLPNGGWPARRA